MAENENADFFGASAVEKLRARALAHVQSTPHPLAKARVARRYADIESGNQPDPSFQADLQRDQVKASLMQEAHGLGIDPTKSPEEFAALAVDTMMRQGYPGAERDAMRVLQWKQLMLSKQTAEGLRANQSKKALADARKTEGEADLLERGMRDKEKRTELLGRLTTAKERSSLPSSSQKAADIVTKYMTRVEKWEAGGKRGVEPTMKNHERNALNELQKIDWVGRIMQGGPSAAVGGVTQQLTDEVIDLSAGQ